MIRTKCTYCNEETTNMNPGNVCRSCQNRKEAIETIAECCFILKDMPVNVNYYMRKCLKGLGVEDWEIDSAERKINRESWRRRETARKG